MAFVSTLRSRFSLSFRSARSDETQETPSLQLNHDAEAQDERIRKLENELVAARQAAQREREERQRIDDGHLESQERRQTEQESTLRAQLADIRGMLERSKEQADRRETAREREQAVMYEMIKRIFDERRQGGEQAILHGAINEMLDALRVDIDRQNLNVLEAVRAATEEQVPYHIQTYLNEFSKALAAEVRQMLSEVRKLGEERRTLQYEIAELMSMKAKHGPGGHFASTWMPRVSPPSSCPHEDMVDVSDIGDTPTSTSEEPAQDEPVPVNPKPHLLPPEARAPVQAEEGTIRPTTGIQDRSPDE